MACGRAITCLPSSVVALDLKSGQRKWHFQEIHNDIWDLDTVSPNILFDTKINGKAVKGLAQAGKSGWVYLLDRATGKPLVPINEKPVPQNNFQKTAATQPFPDGAPFVLHDCPEKVGTYRYLCTPHPFMRGRVIVDENAPAVEGAAAAVGAGPATPAQAPPAQAPATLPRTGASSSPNVILLIATALLGVGAGWMLIRRRRRSG